MRKSTVVLLLVGALFILNSCTSKSDIEELAIDSAKTQLRLKMLQESEQAIKGKDQMKKTYAEVIVQHSDFEAEVSSQSDTTARVVVKAKTVPPIVREKLMGVVEKLEDWKDTRFNMSDALGLVRKEMKNNQTSTENFMIELRKKQEWQVAP